MQVSLNTAFPSLYETQKHQKSAVSLTPAITEVIKSNNERLESQPFGFVEPSSMKLRPENMKGNITDKSV
ncbi:hypothetical protein [Wolinella succinogenes]|uniref:hypothetical protein n=1 Tax=Wolinella succinogenes TaxID=844 RepID=UPI0024099E25|nr:hypothetical protein [Wolinella succinogenes]